MSEDSIDMIRLEGDGNSVILRNTGAEGRKRSSKSDVLVGEFLIDTSFVRGTLKTWIFPEDLREWQQALDSLDAGQDISWRERHNAPWLCIELDEDDDRCRVTIKDLSMSLTTVMVAIPLVDAWFDDAYRRLESVWETWQMSDD